MQTGIVKWFSSERGFGFIHSLKKDYFVHFKEIQTDGFKTLKEGQKVNFTAATSDKGPIAKEVKLEEEI